MKKIFVFLLIFIFSFNCIFASSSVDLVGDGFTFDYEYNYSNDYYNNSNDDIEPYFVPALLTAPAFVEFLVGMGLSLGATGVAYEITRTKDPISSFDELYDRGVAMPVVDALKSKYDEMVSYISEYGDKGFTIASDWFNSIDLSAIAKALGYSVANVESVQVDNVSKQFASLGYKYYLIRCEIPYSRDTELDIQLFDSGSITYNVHFSLQSNKKIMDFYGYTLSDIGNIDISSGKLASTTSRTLMSGYSMYLNGKHFVITNCPDLKVGYNGDIDDIFNVYDSLDKVTSVDTSSPLPVSTPSKGISVTGDAINNYPIPNKGTGILDEAGQVISGDLTLVLPGIKDYIDSLVTGGDIVIDDSVDIPIEDEEDTTIPFVFDGNVNIDSIGGESVISDSSFNFEPLMALGEEFTNKFPFSLPWDLIDIIKIFDAEPVAPKFEVDFVGENIVVLDLSQFESVVKIFRFFILLYFIVGLIKITGNLTQH